MRPLLASLIVTAAMFGPLPAQASDLDQLQRQLAAMRDEVARLSAQVEELKVREVQGPAVSAEPEARSNGSGASAASDWSVRPRGRLQLDAATLDAPSEIAQQGTGFGARVRRAFLGVDGTLPGNFAYRMEADFAGSSVVLTDVYLTHKPADRVTLTVGHHKTFGGLEEMTSDLFGSMLERAAFASAFGFERRVGVSGTYAGNDLIVQLGLFSDNAADLNDGGNDSFSLNGRIVFSPKVAGGILHLGGSAHHREFNGAAATTRYRARPFTRVTDLRFVDTGAFSAAAERDFGAELAYVRGPFHATIEGHHMTSIRPGLPNPSFWGAYAEVGILVTPGDTTGYRNGVYDRIRPARPLSSGGPGAVQINARYDHLDLNDESVRGGRQQTAGVSVIWIPTDNVRFLVNYGHLWIDDAAVSAGDLISYQADVVGMRAQFDF